MQSWQGHITTTNNFCNKQLLRIWLASAAHFIDLFTNNTSTISLNLFASLSIVFCDCSGITKYCEGSNCMSPGSLLWQMSEIQTKRTGYSAIACMEAFCFSPLPLLSLSSLSPLPLLPFLSLSSSPFPLLPLLSFSSPPHLLSLSPSPALH